VRRSVSVPMQARLGGSKMAKKIKAKKRPTPRKAIKRVKPVKRGIPEPNIDAVSDYLSETS
jgi:hypothetical protein